MKKVFLVIISLLISSLIEIELIEFLKLTDVIVICQLWIILFLTILVMIILLEDAIKMQPFPNKTNYKKFAKEYDYYREPLDEISPMMGAFLLGKQIDEPDVVAAMILYLKRKGIDISDSEKTYEWEKLELRSHEKFLVKEKDVLLKNFYDDTYTQYSKRYSYTSFLDALVREDLLDEWYLESRESLRNNGNNKMFFPFIYHTILMTVMMVTPYNATTEYITTLKIIFTIFTLFWSFLDIIIFVSNQIKKEKFTTKAYEYINKAEGAKRFLEDYSLISKREVKQEILFDSYVQTAILLDMKGKLDTDSAEYYNNILNNYSKRNIFKSSKALNGNLILIATIAYMLGCIWVPMEAGANLVLYHFFGGTLGNIIIVSLLFLGETSTLDAKAHFKKVENNKKNPNILIEKKKKIQQQEEYFKNKRETEYRQELEIINENTRKIYDAINLNNDN